MAKGILIFIEHHDGAIRKVSLELLAQARILGETSGDPVLAAVLGKNAADIANLAGQYGADKVFLAEDDKLADYTTGAYTSVLAALVRKEVTNTPPGQPPAS